MPTEELPVIDDVSPGVRVRLLAGDIGSVHGPFETVQVGAQSAPSGPRCVEVQGPCSQHKSGGVLGGVGGGWGWGVFYLEEQPTTAVRCPAPHAS